MKKTTDKKDFVIIDGNAIIHRAYHALPPTMTTKDGTIVNAVYGFATMLLKVINEIKPEYLAISFDVGGGTFRDEVYEDYKANRVEADQDLYDQFPLVYEIVEAFSIPIFTKEGFEADDVIATIVEKNKKKEKDLRNIIVTGDKDLLQLVDDDIVDVFMLKKGVTEYELYNEEAVEKRFGFGPEHITTFKALMGDPSDNIPGVAGVGKKYATDTILELGSIKNIYKTLKNGEDESLNLKVAIQKKLIAGKEDAKMSLELATIVRDVEGVKFSLAECQTHEFDRSAVEKMFRDFEFFSLIKRIPGVQGDSGTQKTSTKKEKKNSSKETAKIITSDKLLEESLKKVLKEKKVSLLVTTKPEDKLVEEPGLVFGNGKNWFSAKGAFAKKAILSLCLEKIEIFTHGAKDLYKVCIKEDTEVTAKVFDTEIGGYVIFGSSRPLDIYSSLQRDLGISIEKSDKQTSLFEEDNSTEEVEAARNLEELVEWQKSEIKSLEMENVFEQLDMPLVPVLAEMELYGMEIDKDLLAKLKVEAGKKLLKAEEKIHKLAGEKFNVASSVQLREILFEKIKLPTEGIKKGKTGYSTAASELAKLRDKHDIIEQIEIYREVAKLLNTYIDVLPRLVNDKTGRIHTNLQQAVTATGRLSSTDPNLQNIPIKTEMGKRIREAFVAEKGKVLVIADYSQIELRVAASLSGDKEMLDVFKKGEDIHTATGAAIFDVEPSEVTKEMRRKAKEVNFGVLFGMGAFGLSQRTGISPAEAKEFIDKYFGTFSGLSDYLEKVVKDGKKNGFVETQYGRRRAVQELNSKNFRVRSAAERIAVNMPIQGTEADIMKLAMIRADKEIKSKLPEAKMLMQVHDELVFEVDKKDSKKLCEIVKNSMENAAELEVPVIVDINVSDNWGDK